MTADSPVPDVGGRQGSGEVTSGLDAGDPVLAADRTDPTSPANLLDEVAACCASAQRAADPNVALIVIDMARVRLEAAYGAILASLPQT